MESLPSTLLDLLAEWQDRWEKGEETPPELLCPRDPALWERLREEIAVRKRFLRQFAGVASGAGAAGAEGAAALPQVPGYEVLEELGRGGMGVVYKARHLRLNRVVALKMILAGAHAGADARARFRREAEAIAQLQHPGIVQVFEVGEHEGRPFFSLEYCAGGSLEEKLAGTPMQPAEAAALAEKLAEATHAAHQAKVIHRDLKPGNVLLSSPVPVPVPVPLPDAPPEESGRGTGTGTGTGSGSGWGTPKITDFGLARQLGDVGQTASGAVVGTPSYMAPEQAMGSRQAGPLSDVYSLGAIFYECLTGRPPFKAATLPDTLLQVVRDEPVAPTRLNAKVPAELETICLKCLQKEPARRYADGQALADDLRRWLDGKPVLARPAGPGERLRKWARRNPAVAALTAAVALALLVGASVATGFALDAQWEARRADAEAEAAIGEAARADQEMREAQRLAGEEQKARGKAEASAEEAKQARAEAEANEKSAKAETYRADVALHAMVFHGALAAARQLDVTATEAALDDVPGPFRRTWEYRHLRQLCRRLRLPLTGSLTWNTVRFSPDGKRLVSGSDERAELQGQLAVWDAHTGRRLFTRNAHRGGVFCAAYSPDGRRIVTGGGRESVSQPGPTRRPATGEIKIWDALSGDLLLTLPWPAGTVNCVAYSPDGSRILSGSGHTNPRRDLTEEQRAGELAVWDARTGRHLLTVKGHARAVWCADYSPDGARIVSGSGNLIGRAGTGELKEWDARTGRLLRNFPVATGNVRGVGYSPDGARIASASYVFGKPGEVKVWDARTGNNLLTLVADPAEVRLHERINHAQVMGLAPWGDRVLKVNPSSGEAGQALAPGMPAGEGELLTGVAYRGDVKSVCYSPDGSQVISGWRDGLVKVWDASTGHALYSLSPGGTLHEASCSPDGKRIATAGVSPGANLSLWDAHTGQACLTLQGHKAGVGGVAYSPDGARVVSASDDKTVKVRDARTGRELLTLKGHEFWVYSVAYSPDGGRFASGGFDKTLRVWDDATGRVLLSFEGHADSVNALRYSPDGSRIASAGKDTTLILWDAWTGLALHTLRGHTAAVNSLAYSRDGSRLASGGEDRTVKVWDAHTGQFLLTIPVPVRVQGVSYSPDGRRIVSAHSDGTLRVWDARSGEGLLLLRGHLGAVQAVSYSPDGERIASAGADRALMIWDAKTGQAVLALRGHAAGVSCLAFSRDGSRLASGSADQTVKIWDAPPTLDLLTLKGHTANVSRLAVSDDGKRIFAQSGGEPAPKASAFKGTPPPVRVLAWDAATGKLLPDAPASLPAIKQPSVLLPGNRRASISGHHVRVDRVPTPDEVTRRREEEDLRRDVFEHTDREFHQAQAAAAQRSGQAFAAAFHLDRLLALSPDERPALLKRRAEVLAAARKNDPNDPWAARALARQAVADPATVHDLKALLPALARHQHAGLDRLHGALLLRSGDARDAALVLRAAARHRAPNTPPIDELLLALALVKLDRRAEARQHLRAAADWIDRGTLPVRAAALAGLAATPAGLGRLAVAPADPRLNPVDHQTAHELASLRAEAEAALAAPAPSSRRGSGP